MPKRSKYEDILQKLDIDETFTKPPKKQRIFNKVKDNVPPIEHYNYMADLLHLPKTKKGYQYAFVVVDLASNKFDVEPMKTKTSQSALNALKSVFKRKILTKPYMSMTTDSGTEFKDVFHKYLNNEDIDHKVAKPYRHKQLANVENLNKQLGRLFNGYMNTYERRTGKPYREWDLAIPIIREDLNELRERKLPENIFEIDAPNINLKAKEPKFKVGDIVHIKLEVPESALGERQNTTNFRVGDYRFDTVPRKVIKILIYPGTPTYRYMVNDINNASFTEDELMLSQEHETEKFEIKQILGKKKIKNKIHYLIWFYGQKKKEAEWIPRTSLIDDGLEELINSYDKNL